MVYHDWFTNRFRRAPSMCAADSTTRSSWQGGPLECQVINGHRPLSPLARPHPVDIRLSWLGRDDMEIMIFSAWSLFSPAFCSCLSLYSLQVFFCFCCYMFCLSLSFILRFLFSVPSSFIPLFVHYALLLPAHYRPPPPPTSTLPPFLCFSSLISRTADAGKTETPNSGVAISANTR